MATRIDTAIKWAGEAYESTKNSSEGAKKLAIGIGSVLAIIGIAAAVTGGTHHAISWGLVGAGTALFISGAAVAAFATNLLIKRRNEQKGEEDPVGGKLLQEENAPKVKQESAPSYDKGLQSLVPSAKNRVSNLQPNHFTFVYTPNADHVTVFINFKNREGTYLRQVYSIPADRETIEKTQAAWEEQGKEFDGMYESK